MQGRKPAGPEYVLQLQGSDQAKQRGHAVLLTVGQEERLLDVCQQLGIGLTRFHVLRHTALQALVTAMEPRTIGRPRRPAPSAEVLDLRRQVAELKVAMRAAQVREEILLARLPVGTREKKTSRRRRRRPA